MPQVTGQGTEVTLENTIKAPFTIFDVEGHSTQDGTPSPDNEVPIYSAGDNENLFDKSTVILNKYINNQGEEVASTGFYASDFISVNPNTNIVLSGNNFIQSTHAAKGAFYNINKEFVSYVNIAIGNNVYAVPNTARYFRFSLKPNDLDIIKVEKGTVATPWSPYGMGCMNEKIESRNIFNPNNALVKNITNFEVNNILSQPDNTDISISSDNYIHGKSSNYIVICSRYTFIKGKTIYNKGYTGSRPIIIYNNTGKVIRTTPTQYIPTETFEGYIGIGINANDTNADDKYIMFSYDENATYSQYQGEQNISIPTQQPFRSIGDVRDGFVKVNGKWYERHWIYRKIFDGTENGWGKTGYTFINDRLYTGKPLSLCSHFTNAGVNWTSSDENYRGKYSTTNTNDIFKCMPLQDMSTTDFKAWLAEQYANGTPVYVDYILETPLDLPCTETQIQQLENKPSTYKDFTIIQSQDETPAYLEVSGIYDLNNLINN